MPKTTVAKRHFTWLMKSRTIDMFCICWTEEQTQISSMILGRKPCHQGMVAGLAGWLGGGEREGKYIVSRGLDIE